VRGNEWLFKIEITPSALEALEAVADRRTRSAIVRRIDALVEEPEKLGKPLRGWLTGFMSIRAAGQRYRVVYKVDDKKERAVIYMVGIRKEGSRRDVYALAERLVQRGLI
jgi:mRNA interferase RelE/StbE